MSLNAEKTYKVFTNKLVMSIDFERFIFSIPDRV